jgi:hypothetical protein
LTLVPGEAKTTVDGFLDLDLDALARAKPDRVSPAAHRSKRVRRGSLRRASK